MAPAAAAGPSSPIIRNHQSTSGPIVPHASTPSKTAPNPPLPTISPDLTPLDVEMWLATHDPSAIPPTPPHSVPAPADHTAHNILPAVIKLDSADTCPADSVHHSGAQALVPEASSNHNNVVLTTPVDDLVAFAQDSSSSSDDTFGTNPALLQNNNTPVAIHDPRFPHDLLAPLVITTTSDLLSACSPAASKSSLSAIFSFDDAPTSSSSSSPSHHGEPFPEDLTGPPIILSDLLPDESATLLFCSLEHLMDVNSGSMAFHDEESFVDYAPDAPESSTKVDSPCEQSSSEQMGPLQRECRHPSDRTLPRLTAAASEFSEPTCLNSVDRSVSPNAPQKPDSATGHVVVSPSSDLVSTYPAAVSDVRPHVSHGLLKNGSGPSPTFKVGPSLSDTHPILSLSHRLYSSETPSKSATHALANSASKITCSTRPRPRKRKRVTGDEPENGDPTASPTKRVVHSRRKRTSALSLAAHGTCVARSALDSVKPASLSRAYSSGIGSTDSLSSLNNPNDNNSGRVSLIKSDLNRLGVHCSRSLEITGKVDKVVESSGVSHSAGLVAKGHACINKPAALCGARGKLSSSINDASCLSGRALDEKNVPVLDKCIRCSKSAKNTPMMRKGPDGCRSMCNACGLRWARHGVC